MDSIENGMYEKQRMYDGVQGAPTASPVTADVIAGRMGRSLPLIAPRFRGGLKTPPDGDVSDRRLRGFAGDPLVGSVGTRNELLKSYGVRIDQPTE